MISEKIKNISKNLAKRFSTPFYLIDFDSILNKHRVLVENWGKYFPKFRLAYSYKTNSIKMITQLLRSKGACAEVVSGSELRWAIEDGFPPCDIYFDGPVKTKSELKQALSLGVNIQIDSLDELDLMIHICNGKNIRPNLSIRLATDYKETKLSRFGLTKKEYDVALKKVAQMGYKLRGLHFHFGSNINSPKKYILGLQKYLSVILKLVEENKSICLDIGGGFPAKSIGKDITLTQPREFASQLADFLRENGISPKKIILIIEPGRSLVEDFGYLVTRVVVRKKRDEGNIVVVDAGINLVRSLSTWYHPVEFIAGNNNRHKYVIYGSNCFESDILGREIKGPREIKIDDIVIIGEAGGYDIPSANVWTRPSPPIYGLWKDARIVIVRKCQSWKNARILQESLQ